MWKCPTVKLPTINSVSLGLTHFDEHWYVLLDTDHVSNYSSKAGLYTAQCEYLQPTFKEMISERLIDIGIHGKWTMFEEALKEYDVNIDEWDEQGKPKNSSDQLKPLW